MLRAMVGLAAVALMLGACATAEPQPEASGQAFGLARAQDCDRNARSVTTQGGPTETGSASPAISTPWTDAIEWQNATSSDLAQVNRDLRDVMYRQCLRATR